MKIKNIIYPIFFLLIGLIIFFYPVIFINKGLMPGDLGDCRFINYILEHYYLFLKGNELHNSLWNLPVFFPYKNTLAYSDILLGGALIYAPIRLFFGAQTSFQIWLVVCCILNYFSFYILLKQVFKFKSLPSSLGAFLFAFSLVRYSQIYHTQLFLQFFSIFSLICFLSIKKENSKTKNSWLFLSAAALIALQLYSSFYLGWFMIFGGIVYFIILFCFKNERKKLIEFIKFYKFEIIISLSFFIFIMLPLLYHYLTVGKEFGFYLSKLNIKYFINSESLIDILLFKTPFSRNCESNIGIGIFTSITVILGIIFNKEKRKFIFLFFFILTLIFGILSLKAVIYLVFPGASAIRAVERVVFLFLIFYCWALANFLSKFKNKAFIFFVIFLTVMEQIPYKANYDWTKEEHNQRIQAYKIEKTCKVLTYDIRVQPDWAYILDIMWMATGNNVYTTNGYSDIPEAYQGEIEGECRYILK